MNTQKGLSVKDLVTTGIFTALMIVFTMLGGMFFAPQGFRIINSVKKNSSLHGIKDDKMFLGWNNDITRII